MQQRYSTGKCHFEDGAGIVRAAILSCSIEISIGSLNQGGNWITATIWEPLNSNNVVSLPLGVIL